MKHTDCNQIRLEIDESDLAATPSSTALKHLRECAACREFQNKQTKLRQLVGSLETVNAPPDFDFRLRARLANSEERSSYQMFSFFPMMRSPGFAVAVLIVLVIGAFAFLRQFVPREQQMAVKQPASTQEAASPAKEPEAPRKSIEQASPKIEERLNQSLVENSGTIQRRPVGASSGRKRAPVAIDFGSTPAPVIRNNQSVAGMTSFPLDIFQESFKVSIDDGRGTSRTISLPSVSFGSRRVLTGKNVSNQFAPNGAW
jgi:hypothetical protein